MACRIEKKHAEMTEPRAEIIQWHAEMTKHRVELIEVHAEMTQGHAELVQVHVEMTQWHAELVQGHAEVIQRHVETIQGRAEAYNAVPESKAFPSGTVLQLVPQAHRHAALIALHRAAAHRSGRAHTAGAHPDRALVHYCALCVAAFHAVFARGHRLYQCLCPV